MKTIFYIIAVVVIAASAFFAFANKKKIESEMSQYGETFELNQQVASNIKSTQSDLDDSTAALDAAKQKNAELIATKDSEESKARNLQITIEKYEAEIEEHNAKLAEFAQIEAELKEMMEDVNVPFEEIGNEYERIEVQRQDLQKEFEELELTVEKLTTTIATNREDITRQQNRLVEMRQRIARNSVRGRITAVDPVWGFVVVNLGQNNSNITPRSDLLVYREGMFLGRLDIQSIEPTQTISDIDMKNLRPGQRIRPGDTVILSRTAGN